MRNDSYVVKRRVGEARLWQDKRPLLGRLDMELTERCNLDCIHCYINQPANDREVKAREMSTEQVKAILTEATELGALTVRFTGGEPLLREDFEELYLFARRRGLKVLLFTNGTLITPELADLLARVPPLEKIEITVYGMSPESYEAVTGVRGAYKAAMRGMELLLERRVPFVVKGALLPPNEEEMEAFESWAATLPWMDRPPRYSMFFDLRARRDSAEKNEQVQGLRRTPEAGVEVLNRRPEAYRREMGEFCSKFMGPPGDALFRCGAGVGDGCVDAYGCFQPCMLLRRPDSVYNLKEGSLKDALTNFFPQMREMRVENPDYLVRCARCFLKGLCEQCPAKSWAEHGTLDTPVEYLCDVAHAQARYLGWLSENEHGWEVMEWRKRIQRMKAEG